MPYRDNRYFIRVETTEFQPRYASRKCATFRSSRQLIPRAGTEKKSPRRISSRRQPKFYFILFILFLLSKSEKYAIFFGRVEIKNKMVKGRKGG